MAVTRAKRQLVVTWPSGGGSTTRSSSARRRGFVRDLPPDSVRGARAQGHPARSGQRALRGCRCRAPAAGAGPARGRRGTATRLRRGCRGRAGLALSSRRPRRRAGAVQGHGGASPAVRRGAPRGRLGRQRQQPQARPSTFSGASARITAARRSGPGSSSRRRRRS